jgi:Lrp/AsnC family transcriptional regulator for asnA, asnC and gidA
LSKTFFTTKSLAKAVKWCQNQGMAGSKTQAVLDDVAKRIIEQLQADGRRSYADIGKAVGLSEAAVRARVQKLTDLGILQIVAVTDPLQLGFHRQVMVGIRVDGDPRKIADELEKIDQVDYLVLTTGRFDILAEMVCHDDDELTDLLYGQIRTLPGIVATETFTYLALRKEHYNWGTPR